MLEIDKLRLFPWARSQEEMGVLFDVDMLRGLSDESAAARLREYGPNELGAEHKMRIFALIGQQFTSPLIFILIGAAIITIFLRQFVETIVIFLAVFINAALGFYQEYRAENTLESLNSYIKNRARVVRHGNELEIDSEKLVPGDIIRLTLGGRVPADARLLSVNNFSVDESFLTGESLPVRKDMRAVSENAAVTERICMAFAGSLIVEGNATAIVTATGRSTEIGRIAELVSNTKNEQTPLQRSLRSLAWVIFAGVAVVVGGLFVLGIARGIPLFDMLLLSAATAVGAIPEALPIALTVILAVGVERIAKKKGIIRSLAAAETLGSTTVVMTDKTGTLTQARMQITGVATIATILSGKPTEGSNLNELSDKQKSILSEALLSTEVALENPDSPRNEWSFIGRVLEVNIARAAAQAGLNVPSILAQRTTVLPFNSQHKFSLSYDTKAKLYTAFGAPDILLGLSTIPQSDSIILDSYIRNTSEDGKRVIGVARFSVGGEVLAADFSHSSVRALEFMGMIVLYDPIRPEAAEAVRSIEEHGASVVMLTGDLKGTAAAIGRELGWELTESSMMTGEELRRLTDHELTQRLSQTKIFARVTPEDKLRIGQLYQQSGQIVAMTGDGVNDAPALKTVDIGIALGSGSDVAKGAADLVLLDDNFKTIVLAIEEGRRIIANIRKSFVYLMSNSLDEVILIGGSLLMALPLPLTAIQIIWVNLFTGSLPALSFAFEKNRDVGYGKGMGSIFNAQVRFLTIGIGILTSLILFLFYAVMLRAEVGEEIARTVVFLCFASYIVVIAFSFKSLSHPLYSYSLFDNKQLNISLLVATVPTIAAMTIPALRNLLDLSLIPLPWLFVVVAWLILNILIVECGKWGYRVFIERS